MKTHPSHYYLPKYYANVCVEAEEGYADYENAEIEFGF